MLKSLLSIFTHTQNAPECRVMKKISNRFHKRSVTIMIVLVSFVSIALKLEKVSPTWPSLNPFQSLPSMAKDDRK